LRLFKEVRYTAGLVLVLAACVNFVIAQETAKGADSPPPQKSTEPFNFPDFTAIQKLGAGGGPRPLLMKVYLSGSNVRLDLSPTTTNLFITSAAKVYKLETFPDKTKSCVVMPRSHHVFMGSPLEALQGAKVERTPAGTDVVDGHKCKVEEAVVTRPDGTVIKSKVWEAEDFKGVPIKIISEFKPAPNMEAIKVGALYGDINFEKVDPALLTPPDNCMPIEKTFKVVEQGTVK
jgi:hypothetical protein